MKIEAHRLSGLGNIILLVDLIRQSGKINIPEIHITESKSTGLDIDLQQIIMNHNQYNDILKSILKYIELDEYKKIGIICDYGKIVSVGFAELLKRDYYQRTIIHHNNLKVSD